MRHPIGDRYLSTIARFLVPIVRRRAWKRVACSITTYRQEVEARASSEKLKEALEDIGIALDNAKQAVEAGDIDCGWRYLQAAQRLELLALGDSERKAAATVVLAEADKLNRWRREAVTSLLSSQDGQAYDPVRVYGAALLRDEHYINEAYKDGLRRAAALWLALALFAGLAALLWIAYEGPLSHALTATAASIDSEPFDVLLSMAVLGFVGAAISAITTVPQSDKSSRIPEMISTIRVMALRLLIGPLSAIVLFFVAKSAFYHELFKPEPHGYTLLVIAFVAGFTERLVRRVVETVAGGKS